MVIEKSFEIKIIDKQAIAFSSIKDISKVGFINCCGLAKGFVDEPSFLSKMWREYNVYIFIALGVFSLVHFIVYLEELGDPPKGVVYPMFYPRDLPPSYWRIQLNRRNNLLTSEIINLAKKALIIKELSEGYEIFMLIKKGSKGFNTI